MRCRYCTIVFRSTGVALGNIWLLYSCTARKFCSRQAFSQVRRVQHTNVTCNVRGLVNSSFPSLRRRCCDSARVPAIRPCLARSLPHLHGHMLTLRLHVPIQVRCRSRKALKNGRDRGKTHIADLVDSRRSAGDLSRSSGGHGHERSATPGRPSIDPPCILDPLPARF